jgi:DNA-binding response OmpR family regulator
MNPSVLIVDDSLTVRMDLAEAFEESGFQVVLAASLAEARQALSSQPVDLVILDILLPDGDGLDFLSELHASYAPGPSVLLLSSLADVADRIRGLGRGADEYVGKPYDRGYVVGRARQLIHARETPQTPGRTRILLVDDSETFARSTIDALQQAGYDVTWVLEGEEGLLSAEASRPALAVVDAVLPGVDGATVIRRIRLNADLSDLPCILVTGIDLRKGETDAAEAGADAFIRKDEGPEILVARIGAVLRSSSNRAEHATEPPTRPTRILAVGLNSPKRILAVDDSLTFLHRLADALLDEKYEIVLAGSGEEALELLEVQPVDCILLDLLMPGIGGRETCRRIKAAPGIRDIPLILLTAVEGSEEVIEGLSAGADDYVSKSSDFEILKARIRTKLRRRQTDEESRQFRSQLLALEAEGARRQAAEILSAARAELIEKLELQNQELEAFSYSISHDLRSPLRAIDGFSALLLSDYQDLLDVQGKSYLQHIRSAAQRMGELIDAILALSRASRAEPVRSWVDLGQVVAQVVEELRDADPGRSVSLEVGEDLVADCDANLLRSVFENLLGNAWKFTGRTARPEVVVGKVRQDGEDVFFVRDNGAGFDAANGAQLFKPFFRLHSSTEFPGTGIGLATVRRIVARHGGRVWAEGVDGKGATFYFTLPVQKKKALPTP